MSGVVLSVESVTLRYGQRVAVENLSFTVAPGEILGLLGANGSGKSTTLSAVAGLLALAAGTIRLHGLCPRRDALEYRQHLGYVPQELALYEELSGQANLRFFGRMYGLGQRHLERRVAEVLDVVRLTDRQRDRVGTYSGGMQRRLNLACALLHRPALLLLDEPTVGLDHEARAAVFDCLEDLRASGTAIVYTTHHLDEAARLCDRRVVLGDRLRVAA
jgi:ABC-2 type transport system ATP-binding protein